MTTSSCKVQRSATTVFFPFHPDIDYYGINLSKGINKHSVEISASIAYPTESSRKLTWLLVNLDRFQGIDKNLKKIIAKDIEKAKKTNKTFVFSNENFSETPSPYLMAQVLKEYIPEADCLIIPIRNIS